MDIRQKMKDIGNAVKRRLPEDFGFFVLVFPFNDTGRANYISNGNREDVINSMKEFLIRCGHKDDWAKDIN